MPLKTLDNLQLSYAIKAIVDQHLDSLSMEFQNLKILLNYKFKDVHGGIATDQRELNEVKCRLAEELEILILDEATSSLDTVAEGFVQKTIALLRDQGRLF